MEDTASGITLREVDASDAPVHYGSDEAESWANGYNSAVGDVRPVVEALQAEVKQLREYAETTRYHQTRHAKAVRELEQLRSWAEDVREAGRLGKINQAGSGRRRGGQ